MFHHLLAKLLGSFQRFGGDFANAVSRGTVSLTKKSFHVLFLLQMSTVCWCLQFRSFFAWCVFAYYFTHTDENTSIGENKANYSNLLSKRNATLSHQGRVCCSEARLVWIISSWTLLVSLTQFLFHRINEPLKAWDAFWFQVWLLNSYFENSQMSKSEKKIESWALTVVFGNLLVTDLSYLKILRRFCLWSL